MALSDQIFLARRQQILDQITAHPETHSQATFQNTSAPCGTTYCVAGWAVMNAVQGEHNLAQAARTVKIREGLDSSLSTGDVAGFLLGLDEYEAHELFYNAEDEESVGLLAQYAAGVEDVMHLPGW